MVALRKAVWKRKRGRLTAESVESASLSLESIDNVHCGHSLSLSVLGVGDSITDDVLQEHFEHTTGLLIDETADTLHSATASEATDGWLGDALDVVTKNLPVTLGASLSETFASFATSRHDELREPSCCLKRQKMMDSDVLLRHFYFALTRAIDSWRTPSAVSPVALCACVTLIRKLAARATYDSLRLCMHYM